MKAWLLENYGSPETFKLVDIPIPEPGEGQVLVKVKAAAINDYDWAMMLGKPYAYRLLFGITKPRNPILGMELSGVVEMLGAKVTSLKVGNAVFGDISDFGIGAFAEYVCVDEQALQRKPDSMTFEHAASLPHAAELAAQGLIELGQLQQGQKVLINGAGGGVGMLALQIAKTYQANVTGVDTGDKLQTMSAMGFDRVIDYRTEDFTQQGIRYDLILDAKTNRRPQEYLNVLSDEGKYVTVGGDWPRILQILIWRLFHKYRLHIVALKPKRNSELINELYAKGKLQPVIDGPYQFEEIPKLIEYFGHGRHTGKVIVSF